MDKFRIREKKIRGLINYYPEQRYILFFWINFVYINNKKEEILILFYTKKEAKEFLKQHIGVNNLLKYKKEKWYK